LVDPNDQDNVGEVYNICSLLYLYTWNSKKNPLLMVLFLPT
jgi:hypothetical protein